MKTSIKFLLSITGILVALLIISLAVLRQDIKAIIASELESKYETVEPGHFHSLSFSPGWKVTIRQGRKHRVLIANEKRDFLKPSMINNGDTLFFSIDAAPLHQLSQKLHVRITAPKLNTIKAAEGTEIDIKTFSSDSLQVLLADQSSFTGNENLFEFIHFITSGKTSIQWTDDPLK